MPALLRDCAWTLRPRRAGQLARAWWWYGRERRGQGDGERRATKDGTREVTCIIEAILLCGGRVYPAALGYGLRGIVSKPTPPRFPATAHQQLWLQPHSHVDLRCAPGGDPRRPQAPRRRQITIRFRQTATARPVARLARRRRPTRRQPPASASTGDHGDHHFICA